MKETKIRVICSIVSVIANFVCIVIDLYLAFSKGQYLYLIPACLFAIGLVFNSVNFIKYMKKYKSDISDV